MSIRTVSTATPTCYLRRWYAHPSRLDGGSAETIAILCQWARELGAPQEDRVPQPGVPPLSGSCLRLQADRYQTACEMLSVTRTLNRPGTITRPVVATSDDSMVERWHILPLSSEVPGRLQSTTR